jgi:RimJ/RimL family protein N-acetyltransferase
MRSAPPAIQLVPWGAGDWDLLVQLNSPEMTEHLGGPESPEKLEDRQRRYVAAANAETAYIWKVILQPEGFGVGNVNFWDREWKGEQVYEMGWGVLPEYQGRRIASAAVAQAIDLARATKRRPAVHAFPSPDNGPSNGICRKLGFELLGEVEFEYPKGHWALSNDWRLAL